MADYTEGTKKDVAEIKFLIHDLRVERFINEVIHFHVTLNTDLEIFGIEQAQALHGEDLQELKTKAVSPRRALGDYSNAVKSFSPDRSILRLGRSYIQTIFDMCELILNPLWGRNDMVLSFLPPDSRSARSRLHYRNCIRWICGVYYRIDHFLAEMEDRAVHEVFDLAEDIRDFTANVIRGYVAEKSSARVELQIDQLDPAVIGGSRSRFRRMFFNLIMNSVDALAGKKVGILNVSAREEADRIVLRVRDDGTGMPPEKIAQLLSDRETLDGELHSLGFVFVRLTIAQLGGELSIDSEVGKGTTMSVSLPILRDQEPIPRPRSRCEKFDLIPEAGEGASAPNPAPVAREAPVAAAPAEASGELARPAGTDGDSAAGAAASPAGGSDSCGALVVEDYERSEAQFRGSIFAMAVTESGQVDFFTHKPYERHWNISHEDLTPMFFLATVRGRLEEDEDSRPQLILKAPQDAKEFFEFKEVAEPQRGPDAYLRMVHDEYVRVARKLIETGMPPATGVQLTDLGRFFPGQTTLSDDEPFPLESLAQVPLNGE